MVRTYTDGDYEKLKELYQHTEWYGGVFDEARDGRERLAKKIIDDPDAIVVYEQDGRIFGTVSIIDDGRVAWLYRLVVTDNDQTITMTPSHISPLLQNYLTAPIVSFARHRNYSYASSQKLTIGTRQVVFRYSGEM